jgi:CBS domain-containing protein
MKRWVYAHRYVTGPPVELERTLLHRSMALLRAATDSPEGAPTADGSFLLALRSKLVGLEVAKMVRVSTGVAHRAGGRVILPVRWHADPVKHGFPTFDGVLELEPLDARRAQLSLIGSYRVPLGPVGALADAVLLRNVGQATADTIIGALAEQLTKATGLASASEHVAGPRAGEPIRVADVMTADPLMIDASFPLRTAALMLFHAQVSGAPVVSTSGELVGVLSEADLLAKEATMNWGFGRRALEENRRREGRTAGEVCSTPAKTTVPDARLAEVARRMLDEDVNRLVVIDEGRVAGIVTRHDVLAALIREDADIEAAVRKVVRTHAGPGVRVSVLWGEVTLTGVTEFRSSVTRLLEVLHDVEGVMTVDAAEVTWEIDDAFPPLARI